MLRAGVIRRVRQTMLATNLTGGQMSFRRDVAKGQNPHIKHHSNRRGYVACTATPSLMRADFRVVDAVRVPGAPLRTSVTMMYGLGESNADRVEHLLRVREVQARTGGFTAFICWPLQPEGTPGFSGMPRTDAVTYLRTLALSRIVLAQEGDWGLLNWYWLPHLPMVVLFSVLVAAAFGRYEAAFVCLFLTNLVVKLHDRSLDLREQYSGGVDWAARLRPLLEDGRAGYAGGGVGGGS